MATDYLYQLKNSVITALEGDGALAAMVNGIYDNVPPDAKYPLIAVGGISAKTADNLNTKIFHASFPVKVYSRARGGEEASSISAEVRRVLLGGNIVIDECVLTDIREVETSVSREKDGVAWNASVSFAVVLRQEGSFR